VARFSPLEIHTMKTTTKKTPRSRRQHPSRDSLIIETLAEIALGDLSGLLMRTNLQGRNEAEALSDTTRARLINAAGALADYELERPALWESNDWRDTCDFIAARLNQGLTVTRADLLTVLR